LFYEQLLTGIKFVILGNKNKHKKALNIFTMKYINIDKI